MDLMQAFKEAEKQLPVLVKSTTGPISDATIQKPRQVPKPKPQKPIFENADFVERVAILIESGGHSSQTAHQLAMEEMGGEQLDLWKYRIGRLPTSTTLKDEQLFKAATAFLKSPAAAMAAHYGWDDLAVFGLFKGPPRAMVRRHDAMGLVPALAWSRIGSQLVDIDSDRATIKTRSGNTLKRQRHMTGRRFAFSIWDMSY